MEQFRNNLGKYLKIRNMSIYWYGRFFRIDSILCVCFYWQHLDKHKCDVSDCDLIWLSNSYNLNVSMNHQVCANKLWHSFGAECFSFLLFLFRAFVSSLHWVIHVSIKHQQRLPLNSASHFLVLQVLIAVGRDACTDKIGLDKAGVKVNPK